MGAEGAENQDAVGDSPAEEAGGQIQQQQQQQQSRPHSRASRQGGSKVGSPRGTPRTGPQSDNVDRLVVHDAEMASPVEGKGQALLF